MDKNSFDDYGDDDELSSIDTADHLVEKIESAKEVSSLSPLRGKLNDKEKNVSQTFWISPRAHERLTRIIASGRDPRLGAFKSDFYRDALEDRMDKHDALFGSPEDAPSIHYKRYQVEQDLKQELRAVKEQREFLQSLEDEMRQNRDDDEIIAILVNRAQSYYTMSNSSKVRARLRQIIPGLE